MLAREIIQTCTNVHVARAALISIGGDFAAQVAAKARETDRALGAFVADAVNDFSRHAGDDEWDGVDEAARGSDQPILSGLRHILGVRLGIAAGAAFTVDPLCASSWTRSGFARGACLQ
ncbi:MAG TPA: hypothetical protein VKU03_04535 [Roseiarcus sp.]|nr:hypothetical protein [Roseiarcus sp.]